MPKFLPILLLVLSLQNARAQQTSLDDFYRYSWQRVNPAAKDRWQYFPNNSYECLPWLFTGSYRQQWLGSGFDKGSLPMSGLLSIELEPKKIRHNDLDPKDKVGLVTLYDRTDAISNTTLLFNYARRVYDETDNYIYLGLNAGATAYSVSQKRLNPADPDDEVYQNALGTSWVPEASVGIFYRNNRYFYAGLSLPHLVSFWLGRPDNASGAPFHPGRRPLGQINAMLGGYLSPDEPEIFMVEPSLWVRYSPGVSYRTFSQTSSFPLSFDFGLRALWQNKFWLGAGYGSNQQVNFEVAWDRLFDKGPGSHKEDFNRVRIGLNYSFPVGWNVPKLGNTFQITLSYSTWGSSS